MSSSTWRSIGGRDSEGGPEWLPASPFLVGARFERAPAPGAGREPGGALEGSLGFVAHVAGDPPTFALARFAGPGGTVAFSILAHIVTGVKP
jgi:hypothetical protein